MALLFCLFHSQIFTPPCSDNIRIGRCNLLLTVMMTCWRLQEGDEITLQVPAPEFCSEHGIIRMDDMI
jgi:hypothetical protein